MTKLFVKNIGQNMNPNSKRCIYQGFALILGVIIIFGLIYYAGTQRFLEILRHISPMWILAAILIYATSWIFRTYRLKLLTNHAGTKIGMYELFKLYISGYALNILLPAKIGDAATVGYLKLKGIGIGRSAAIIIQTRVLDALSLILLSLPTILIFWGDSAPELVQKTLYVSLVIVAIPIAIVLLDSGRIISKTIDRITRHIDNNAIKLVAEKAKDAYDSYCDIISDKNLLFSTIFLSIIIWSIDALTCYSVSIAIGKRNILLPIIILAVSIGNLGKSIPATPGSIGIYEGMLAATLSVFGVPAEEAIAIAILDHAIKNIFTLAIGIPMTTSMGLEISKK